MAVPRGYARRVTVVIALLLGAMVANTGAAWAAPTPSPTPPPNPTDQQLQQSKNDIAAAAGQVGALTSRLDALRNRADQLGATLEARRETANKALVDLTAARQAADAAAARVHASQVEASAAASAVEQARQRLDQFLAVAYEQGVRDGAFGLLMEASDPSEVVRRAELTQAVADQQAAALEGVRRAQIAKVNADSLARAAQLDADAKRDAAEAAKRAADSAMAEAKSALAAGLAELHRVDAARADLEHQLDVLTAKDAGLRAQRQRYLDYQAKLAASATSGASDAAARIARAGVSGGVKAVIDRALSAVGTTYAWGGGNAHGPTKGIRDGGVADEFGDFRKTGFDCSGLMLYAFGALGIGLPHYSGYQYNAGKKVPISQIRPGDMLFWANGNDIHHVALYIGDGKMIEAPYSGGKVRITPVRYGNGLLPYATRLIG